MKLGVVLPSFADTADEAFAAAVEVEAAGLDGVFVYDHLWPLGAPGQPAISAFPLLGALAVRTEHVMLGTLVARVGLVPNTLLVEQFRSVHALSAGRLIAGIGTGDAKSSDENHAFGAPFDSASERLAALGEVVSLCTAYGISSWVGGRSQRVAELAREKGVPLNLWAADVNAVAQAAAAGLVTWSGVLPNDRALAAALLSGVATAGAAWAVVGWPGSVKPVLDAAFDGGVQRRI